VSGRPSKLKRTAEDQVAKQIDAIRASAKLPPLKRVNPSLFEPAHNKEVAQPTLSAKGVGLSVRPDKYRRNETHA
jgi:hypothetical protein